MTFTLTHAFEITEEDIATVLQRERKRIVADAPCHIEGQAAELIGRIDHMRVVRAALKAGDDLGDQTDAAHDEIMDELIRLSVLSA